MTKYQRRKIRKARTAIRSAARRLDIPGTEHQFLTPYSRNLPAWRGHIIGAMLAYSRGCRMDPHTEWTTSMVDHGVVMVSKNSSVEAGNA